MPAKKTKKQVNEERLPQCPHKDTMKECGSAYRSGCRETPCREGHTKQLAEQRTKARAAKPQVIGLPKETPRTATERHLRAVQRENDARPHGTLSEDGLYRWHTEQCCKRVWRRINWPCV